MTETTTPPWDIIDTPGWQPIPTGGYARNPNAAHGHLTPRALCHGDIVTVSTYEAGDLVGIVRHLTIGAKTAVVVLELHTGSRRSLLAGTDEPAFEIASADIARAFRAALGPTS